MGPRSSKTDKVRKLRYRSGLAIPNGGVYLVYHREHRLPHEVTLLAGQLFPRCQKCDKAVEFELLLGIADEKLMRFPVVLHQIPPIEEKEDKAAAAVNSDERVG